MSKSEYDESAIAGTLFHKFKFSVLKEFHKIMKRMIENEHLCLQAVET